MTFIARPLACRQQEARSTPSASTTPAAGSGDAPADGGSGAGASGSSGNGSGGAPQAGMGQEKIVGSERLDLQIPKVDRAPSEGEKGVRRGGGGNQAACTPAPAKQRARPRLRSLPSVPLAPSGRPDLARAPRGCCARPPAQEVIEKLRYSVFGYDTLWVTSVDNYQVGLEGTHVEKAYCQGRVAEQRQAAAAARCS
jgi:hypothetical protein